MEKICFPKEYRMKKLSEIVLFLLLSAFCVGLAACSSDDDGGISVSGRTLEPYLPDEFSSKNVDALYVKSESGDYPSENVRNYSGTYAFYFFGDKTFVMTACRGMDAERAEDSRNDDDLRRRVHKNRRLHERHVELHHDLHRHEPVRLRSDAAGAFRNYRYRRHVHNTDL